MFCVFDMFWFVLCMYMLVWCIVDVCLLLCMWCVVDVYLMCAVHTFNVDQLDICYSVDEYPMFQAYLTCSWCVSHAHLGANAPCACSHVWLCPSVQIPLLFCARNRANKVMESMPMHVSAQASVQCMTMHVADCLVYNAIQPSGSLCSLIKHQVLQVQHLITCTCPVSLPMLASS